MFRSCLAMTFRGAFHLIHFSKRFAILLLGVLLAGCADDGETSNQPKVPTAAALEEVSLVLNWYPETEHGGYYAALVHGFYEEAGLKVTIIPGGPNAPVLQKVDRKSVTFGVTNADRVLLGRAQEADVVAVMSPLQISPRCIMVHATSGIETLADLKDVTLAMNSGATWAQFLRKRLPLENVRIVDNASVARFLDDEKYAQQAYVFSEPFVAKSKGGDPRSLMVSELGFNPYTSLLITHADTITEDPQTVRKMVEASIRGWQKYRESPGETNKYIHQQNPEMELDILDFGAEAMKPLYTDDETPLERLGTMTAARWKTLSDQLVQVDVLKPGEVDPQQAFTTQFLPVANGTPDAE
jgi:NitT/TauT family transport system substrate-binding protein